LARPIDEECLKQVSLTVSKSPSKDSFQDLHSIAFLGVRVLEYTCTWKCDFVIA